MIKTRTPNVGDLGLNPGQETISHMPQLKIPRAATKIWCSQINIKKEKKEKNPKSGP